MRCDRPAIDSRSTPDRPATDRRSTPDRPATDRRSIDPRATIDHCVHRSTYRCTDRDRSTGATGATGAAAASATPPPAGTADVGILMRRRTTCGERSCAGREQSLNTAQLFTHAAASTE
jgi:hypothetical protein